MTRRTERVGEQIRAELSRLLREEVTDPRIGMLTLTRVDLSPDFRNARVYWSSLEGGERPDPGMVEGLDSAAGFLRRGLARALSTKRVPELHFTHDPSLAAGARTLGLLREVREEGAGPASQDEEATDG